MPDVPQFRQVCALLRDGQVLTDDEGRLPSYDDDQPWGDLTRRAGMSGDPGAVPVAPQVEVGTDPVRLLSVFGSRTATSVDGTWRSLDELDEEPAVVEALRRVVVDQSGAILVQPPP